jgi:5-formyltetrahydrofolate cyclo-ligase
MTKEEVRLLMKQRLGQLTAAEKTVASAAICKQVVDRPEFQNANSVLLFAPLPGEPDIGAVFDAAFTRSHQVAIPRLAQNSDRLDLWRIPSRAQLQPGKKGLLQPDLKNCSVIDGSEIDFALVPGLAFNRQGIRLGRGGGYYDRLLLQLGPKTFRIGCFFDCQLLPDLIQEPHDQLLDWILTETQCVQVVPSK